MLNSNAHRVEHKIQGLIHEKIGFENGPFTKIRDLETDPKIKKYNAIFHIRFATNEFARK